MHGIKHALFYTLLLAMQGCGSLAYGCLELQASRPTFRIDGHHDASESRNIIRAVDIESDLSGARSESAMTGSCDSPAQCFDAIAMELYRSADGRNGDYNLVQAADTFEFVDRDIVPGVTYHYRMGLVKLIGDEDPSPVVTEWSLATEVATGSVDAGVSNDGG